jgi:hypothetical protein
MPAGVRPSDDVPFPVRGTPGGFHDVWDDPDEAAAMRQQLEDAARRSLERARALGKQLAQPLTADESPNANPEADRS